MVVVSVEGGVLGQTSTQVNDLVLSAKVLLKQLATQVLVGRYEKVELGYTFTHYLVSFIMNQSP